MMLPTTAALDIETYGAVARSWSGHPMPEQTVFHPYRSMVTDNVTVHELIQTVSLTYPKADPTYDAQGLASLEPGPTFVFRMNHITHRLMLKSHLARLRALILMNGGFDLSYMWTQRDLKPHLDHRPLLIDLSILNYLHDETRPERSLKNLGPILQAYAYDETLKHKRFKDVNDPDLADYNGQDTHNTLLAVREMARRIIQDFPDSPKASNWCLNWYSDVLWMILRMTLDGVCLSPTKLQAYHDRLNSRVTRLVAFFDSLGQPIEGPGSQAAKKHLLQQAIDAAAHLDENILDELELTEKKKEVSINDANRHLLLSRLDPQLEESKYLRLMGKHAKAQKMISSYTYPLLYHRRKKPSDQSSRLVQYDGSNIIYPSWYVTPSPFKDGAGDTGGTQQGRITCKGPAVQTFPPPIQRTITSRYWRGRKISFDLSQIELRVAALLSGEPSMVSFYQTGVGDLHRDTAEILFGHSSITNDLRQGGKMVNFADLFLSGAPTMWNQLHSMGLHASLEDLQRMEQNRRDRRPGLFAWQVETARSVQRNGYLELPFTGQSRHYVAFTVDEARLRSQGILKGTQGDKRIHEIVNQPIQTTAGNTLLAIQVELDRLLPPLDDDRRIHMTHQIYDAVYFDEAPDQDVEPLIEEAVRRVSTQGYWAQLQDHYGHKVPLAYDMEG